jgi:hypothetical protein
MPNIITPEQIQDYKDVGKKIDAEKMNPIISQAQDVDLRDYLGATFYFDVLANLDNPTYQDLLSGGTFTKGTVTYYQEGIKALLADLFMSRFVMQINTNITPFGATTKIENNSEPTDRNTLKDIAQFNKEMAGSKWEIIKMYLDANQALFPNYNSNVDTIATGERRLRFRKI